MKHGEKLIQFLHGLALDRFFGTVTIKYEHGKVTHVETETRRVWQYRELPERAWTGEQELDERLKRDPHQALGRT